MCCQCQQRVSDEERLAVAKARAEAGAAWLDENEPGWADRIDLSILEMSDTCIMVQLFGSWFSRPDHLRSYTMSGGWSIPVSAVLGFDAYPPQDSVPVSYGDLNRVWPPLIEQRKSPATAK